MFATTTVTKNLTGRTQLQQSLERETVRTQSQEVGLDDHATTAFENQADPAAPIFRRSTVRSKAVRLDLTGDWARA